MVKRACMWAWPHLCNKERHVAAFQHPRHYADRTTQGWVVDDPIQLSIQPWKGIWNTIHVRHVRVGVGAVELERHQTLPNQIRYGHETIKTR
jgi:hypothetical protein